MEKIGTSFFDIGEDEEATFKVIQSCFRLLNGRGEPITGLRTM